jgi:DNA-binding transcriptional LysR family regulator
MVNNRAMNEKKVETLWSHLHWLTVLGEHKSFTTAAARLGVSKAAMSQHIAELERAAGVALVQRTTRSVRLTEAGERLVDQTRGLFDEIGRSFAGVRDLAAAPRGLVRVTAPVAFGRQHLVPRLPEFLRAHPEVRVELDLSDRLRSLALEGYDLAIRHTNSPPETHVAQKLADTRAVLVASRAYLRRRGAPQVPQDLPAHACLHYPRAEGAATWSFAPAPSGATKAARGEARAADPVTVAVTGPLAVNNSECLRDAAVAGMGIALLPDFSAQSALASDRLVEVLPGWRSVGAFGDALYAIRPYSSHASKAVQAFSAYLREAFAQGFGAN